MIDQKYKTDVHACLTPDSLHTFSFYRTLLEHPILADFVLLISAYTSEQKDPEFRRKNLQIYYTLKAQILAYAFNKDQKNTYAESPWQDFLITQILNDENPLTLLLEQGPISKQHPFIHTIYHDFKLLLLLYHFDWKTFLKDTQLDDTDIFSVPVFSLGTPYNPIKGAFDTNVLKTAFETTNDYIAHYGLGIFERSSSFKLLDNGSLSAITHQHYKPMDALIGYEHQKENLITNTASFINHYTGLNILLQGDMGTGKSTMVKALLDTFKNTKLKMVEIKKDHLKHLPAFIESVKNRPYPFILFIDDLSFNEDDKDYKLFKNIIEGSLEENPPNILIYATSNKRHLISETRSERDNAIHTKDVMEEKLSLSSRFGLVLSFEVPNQKGYLAMVLAIAKEENLCLPEDQIKTAAIQWELRHLNRSGRTADQFIAYLKTQTSKRH